MSWKLSGNQDGPVVSNCRDRDMIVNLLKVRAFRAFCIISGISGESHPTEKIEDCKKGRFNHLPIDTRVPNRWNTTHISKYETQETCNDVRRLRSVGSGMWRHVSSLPMSNHWALIFIESWDCCELRERGIPLIPENSSQRDGKPLLDSSFQRAAVLSRQTNAI